MINDLTINIKCEFEDALADGMSIKAATKHILESFEDVLEDDEKGPTVNVVIKGGSSVLGSGLGGISKGTGKQGIGPINKLVGTQWENYVEATKLKVVNTNVKDTTRLFG